MQDIDTNDENGSEQPQTAKGNLWLVWLLILVMVGGIIYQQSTRNKQPQNLLKDQPKLTQSLLDLQGRLLLGAYALIGQSDSKQILEQLERWKTGSLVLRLRYIPMAGELDGPEKALQETKTLKEETDKKQELLTILEKLYQDLADEKPAFPSLTDKDKDKLKDELSWYARLALNPKLKPDVSERQQLINEARETAMLLLGSVLGGFCSCGMGLIGVIVFLVILGNQNLSLRLSSTPNRGAIYAETFLIWLILFWSLQILVLPFLAKQGISVTLLRVSGFLFSLLALYWPVIRGVQWSTIRQEIGLHSGDNVAIEFLWGIAVWAMNLPLLVLGFLVMWVLMNIQGIVPGGGGNGEGMPAHPIFYELADGQLSTILQMLFLASVMAPLIEETMFRGVLYRHLRESTGPWGRASSVLFSALFNGLIFAWIHPQGALGVPVLVMLAFGFSIAREWRGSLIAPMVAHGIHNGLLIVFLSALLNSR